MKEHAQKVVGKPQGENGKGYSLGQAMQLHLESVDFLADEIQKLREEIASHREALEGLQH